MTTPATLSCKELVELVTDYLDGAMAEADRARFDAHLAICPPCVEYVAQIGRTVRTVSATSDPVASSSTSGDPPAASSSVYAP